MNRAGKLICLMVVLMCVSAHAQISIPLSGRGGDNDKPKSTDPNRLLTGTVTDATDQPAAGAVVYLKNTKTLAVKSYITDEKGAFRFPSLSPNVDFEVYAERKGKRSSTKTLSSFDSRKQVQFNLKLEK